MWKDIIAVQNHACPACGAPEYEDCAIFGMPPGIPGEVHKERLALLSQEEIDKVERAKSSMDSIMRGTSKDDFSDLKVILEDFFT